ncbi:MAG: GTPase ObgE [Patescibacteria group bacterium]|nr:GTPase ObgE [Patescibacteria group bacterium]
MAFVDEIIIDVAAGSGGNGVRRFRHEKNREFGGPSGGDGGKGGNVYAVAVRDIHLLSKYRTKKEFRADNGKDGGKNSLHGADGKDLDILLPTGSIITNTQSGEKFSFKKEGDRVLILTGGKGGRGNESFKSSTNRAPKEFTLGRPGDEEEFFIEVELIADIGFIGLPNAGKTSLLNTLTRAKGKVGAYPFTTLEPNLGEFYGYIISDIPGLIEGAAKGKGLGHKFLRHVRRTKILVHLISLENEDMVKAYRTIRKELESFDSKLLEKKEIILLSKTDLIADKKEVEKIVKKMKKITPAVYTISLYDDEAIKKVQDLLVKGLEE